MGEKLHPTLLFCLIISLFPHFQCEISEAKGFSLKLVRRDVFDDFPDAIHPFITQRRFLFTIDVTIGTPSRKKSLIFDPASALTWTQCIPCPRCSKQDYPLFDPKKSSSYKKLSPTHPLARFFTCSRNGGCLFNTSYLSDQSVAGIASVETFTLSSNKNVPESIRDVVFGCSNTHKGQITTSSTSVAGIMGMNRSPLSFIGQMGTRSVRRFSYCLPRLDSSIKSTHLRFGNDVSQRGNFQKTNFLRETNDYTIKLQSISIAGRTLNLPNTTFSKGCALDTGITASRLEKTAYTSVMLSLVKYFNGFNLTRAPSDLREGDLCYRLEPGFKNYPSMTLHFEGAVLEVPPENLFQFAKDRFCLALFETKDVTILGAYQQQNVRFIYDISNDKLMFGKEDCSKDKA